MQTFIVVKNFYRNIVEFGMIWDELEALCGKTWDDEEYGFLNIGRINRRVKKNIHYVTRQKNYRY